MHTHTHARAHTHAHTHARTHTHSTVYRWVHQPYLPRLMTSSRVRKLRHPDDQDKRTVVQPNSHEAKAITCQPSGNAGSNIVAVANAAEEASSTGPEQEQQQQQQQQAQLSVLLLLVLRKVKMPSSS